MSYEEDECQHGMNRDWCAVCKLGNKVYDEVVPSQRNDDDDRFLNNLAKMMEKK